MEAIVVLFAEFLGLALAPLITLFVEVIVLGVSLVAQLTGISLDLGLTFRREKEPDPAQQALRKKAREKRLRLFKRISIVILAMLALTIATLAAIQWVFFDNTLRWVMSRVERNTGIKVEFTEASGNFFTGRFNFEGLHIARPAHPQTQFDFRIDTASVHISIDRVLASPVRVDSLKLSGIEGDFRRVALAQQSKPRRPFVITQLNIEKANLRVTDATKEGQPQYSAFIDRWESAPLRSQWAASDILFRTSATGTIQGGPFVIATEQLPKGRRTHWSASGLPVPFLSQFMGGPLRYFRSGTVDVLVEDQWTLDKTAGIDLDWKITVKDFEPAMPERPVITRLTDPLIVAWLKGRGKQDLEFAFSFVMNEDEFRSATSLDAAGFWQNTVEGLTLELASRAGIPPEKLREDVKSTTKAFKDYLDKRRKTNAPAPVK